MAKEGAKFLRPGKKGARIFLAQSSKMESSHKSVAIAQEAVNPVKLVRTHRDASRFLFVS